MSGIAGVGAASYLAGTGLNAIGQRQALRAMQDVWSGATRAQTGYDNDLNASTQKMLATINPEGVLGVQRGQELAGQSDAVAQRAVAALKARGGRKAGGVEGKAAAAQAGGGSLAALLRSGRLQALIQGMQSGNQDLNANAGRFAVDSGIIRNDARSAAALVPMQERAAGMRGGEWRQLGGLFQNLGTAGMMYGMSQPGSGAGKPDIVEQGPSGGADAYATSSQYAASGQGPLFADYFR